MRQHCYSVYTAALTFGTAGGADYDSFIATMKSSVIDKSQHNYLTRVVSRAYSEVTTIETAIPFAVREYATCTDARLIKFINDTNKEVLKNQK